MFISKGMKGVTKEMPKTVVRENDTLDEALKRFKRDVSRQEPLLKPVNVNTI